MSTDRLERAMRRALGTSPKQYLLRLRAEHAGRLLATTDRPIVRIAAECGYADQAHMARDWRSIAGSSPTRWMADERLPIVQGDAELDGA